MAAPETARLRAPARLDSVPALRELALGCAARAGLGPEAVQRVDLVLEEALMNVIHHAYAGGGGDVELACRAAGGGLLLILRDWGPPFDPLHQPELQERLEANLESDLDGRQPGGLGVLLMRTMAAADYTREDGANVLTLRILP